MLKYLIQITQDLFVPGSLLALLYAYTNADGRKKRHILDLGAVLFVIAAAVMAYLKQTTNKINSEMWSVRILVLSLVSLILFYIFSVRPIQKATKGIAAEVCGAVLIFGIFMEVLPTVMLYPWGFIQIDESVLSTEFIFKAIGFAFGLILIIVAGLALNMGAAASGEKVTAFVLKILLLVNGIRQSGRLLSLLKVRVRSGHLKGPLAASISSFSAKPAMRVFTQFVSNKSMYFVYAAVLAVLVVPVIIWSRSFKVNEPYENPAQHRKIRAKWRDRRRWATTAVICCILSVLNLSVVKAFNEKEAEITPAEECEIRDNKMYVSLEQVADGHLHRFAHISDNNVEIRFIVIKKPNSNAYGIGLDACDICGKTGYYERGDQVVCNRCDVVMNVNTIGFKGGCNPIPIDYKIENGYIIVPIDVLLEHEKEFK